MTTQSANLAFSATRLMSYEECPYKFYNQYILELESDNTVPLALGSAVHEAIESILKGTTAQLAIMHSYQKYEHVGIDLEDVMQLVENAPYKQFMGAAVTVEQHWRMPLDDAGQYWITGVIDVADNEGNFLADWKTNRKVYSPTDTKQLAMYAWALSRLKGKSIIKATLYFLRFYKQQEQSHTFFLHEMEDARRWALALTKEINFKNNLVNMFASTPVAEDTLKAQFPAKPSSRCNWCPFSVECVQKFTSY